MKKGISCIIVFMLLITTTTIAVAYPNFIIDEKNLNKKKDTPEHSPGADSWKKTFGGWRRDSGFSVQQTTDGGYIIVGETLSFGAGKNDIWLIKTDSAGEKIWDKTFGGKDRDYGYSVQQTSDGGYIITGSTQSYGNGLGDVWLIKTDSEGNKMWDKTFGDTLHDSGAQVQQTTDGGYIVVGDVNNDGGGNSDVWVIRTDSEGNLVWDKKFDGNGLQVSHDYGTSIALTSDGGYILTAATFTTQETNGYNIWLLKIDDNGSLLWKNDFGQSDDEFSSSVMQTNDGGYIIMGVDSYSESDEKVWLIKADGNGAFQWEKKYAGIGKARGESVQQTSDGGYIIAGFTYTGFSRYKALLIKTDETGTLEWSKVFFGGLGICIAFSARQTTDGGYVIVGDSNFLFNTNVWLVKYNGK